MIAGFQCAFDKRGDITVANGAVFQPSSGVRLAVGSGGAFSEIAMDRSGSEYRWAMAAMGGTFVGGSGRNVIATGLPPATSGPRRPIGFFRPSVPGEFTSGGFVLQVSGPSSAVIADGDANVAELSAGGTAPVGSYVATAHGKSVYNGGADFTLTVAAEGGSVGIPDARVSVSAGTAIEGVFTALDEVTWEGDLDADWQIEIATDGTAEITYLGDAMGTREAGELTDPSGIYEATALGMETYNLTDAEPTAGEPFRFVVDRIGRTPRVGWVWCEVTTAAGVLASVAGPFFGATLPASSGDMTVFPLAYSDGYNFRQDHVGTIVWPASGGGGGSVPIVPLANLAAYLALTPEEQMNGSIYVTPRPS